MLFRSNIQIGALFLDGAELVDGLGAGRAEQVDAPQGDQQAAHAAVVRQRWCWPLLLVVWVAAAALVGGMAGLLGNGLDAAGQVASRPRLLRWLALTTSGGVLMLLGLWRA